MKIENQFFDKIAKAAQDVYKKTEAVFGEKQTSNDKGVIYGGSSVDAPIFAGEKSTALGTEEIGKNPVKESASYLGNTMTKEDYEAYMEEAGNLEDTEIETIVTVVDKIRINLATYCQDFQGELDGVSKEAVEQIVGNPAFAATIAGQLKEQNLPITEANFAKVMEAVSMAESLEPVNSATALYLLQNHLKPTIENLYIAEHSVGNVGTPGPSEHQYVMDGNKGYFAKTGSVDMNADLEKQIAKIIQDAGLVVDDVTIEAAQWMMENQVAVTEENLLLADQISKVAMPQDVKKLVESIVSAMANGSKPTKALLSNGNNFIRRATDAVNTVRDVTTEAIKAVVAAREAFTIENLSKWMKAPAENLTIKDTDIRVVQQYRQIEELRLQMTLDVSVRMLRKGFEIETMQLSNLVDQLKHVENEYFSTLLESAKIEANEEHVNRLASISTKLEVVKTVPEYVLASALEEKEGTITNLHDKGLALRDALARAGEAYEVLMTKPRRDMGDSIQKAFQNVDAILDDLGMEPTDSNRRAVRILGYNNMNIEPEVIRAIKAKDAEVQYMLKKLNPSVALEMIRRNINPLDMPIEEVNQIIDDIKVDLNQTGEEKYSEFLWKLEKSNDITPAEREAYVGIFRLLHQVEKSDGAVIGSLMEQNREFTMKNLMNTVRIRSHKGINIELNETTGAIEGGGIVNSITDQIERGYTERLVQQGLDLMEPGRLHQVMQKYNVMDLTLEQFVNVMSHEMENPALQKEYFEEQLKNMEQFRQTDAQVIANLQKFDLPVTFQNLLSMEGLLHKKNSFFKDIMDLEENPSELEDAFMEALGDKDSLQAVYETTSKKVERALDEKNMENGVTSLDVRVRKTLCSQWRMVTKLSREENYFIPLQTEAGYTGMHLTIAHKEEMQGKVSISMESGILGNVTAEFYVSVERISGYVATDKAEGLEILKAYDQTLQANFAGVSQNIRVDYILAAEQNISLNWEESGGEGVLTTQLYQIAKGFVENIRGVV